MGSFVTIAGKVAVILVLVVLGVVVSKTGILSQKSLSEITTLLLHIVTPCLIVNSFLSPDIGHLELSGVILAILLPAAAMGLAIALSYLFFRKETESRKKVLRFSVIFSNAGFMGFPLIESILGPEGVLYGSFFVAVFNLICWTYGYLMMGGGKIRVKSLLLNPGIIGLAIGMPIYFLRIRLPDLIASPVEMLAGLNTPLAMMVVGGYIARVKPREFFSDMAVYKMAAIRLILCPAVYLGVLALARPAAPLLLSSLIQSATPVAANCVLFAVEYGRDAELASKSVAVSTALSLLTIPVFTVLGQMMLG